MTTIAGRDMAAATAARVPFLDLGRQYAAVRREVDAAVARVLAGGWYVLGREVEAFEAEFAAYLGVGHVVGVNSGTDALSLALRACGVGPGDGVITAANTAVPTICAIAAIGAVPVLADVDPATAHLTAGTVAAALAGPRVPPRGVKAVVPVHLYGRPLPLGPILALAREAGLKVVEDAAQAHGATDDGRAVGTRGDAGCFSFYPTKNLGACGDAGAVATDDPEIARRVGQLRNYGEQSKYHNATRGVNSRLDEVQAAILRAKLPFLDAWVAARRALAEAYRAGLADAGLTLPPADLPGCASSYHLFVVGAADRDALRAGLLAEGVETAVHYPRPVHFQPAYLDLGYGPGDLPGAERSAAEVLSLPLYPELTAGELARVIEAVRRVSRGHARGGRPIMSGVEAR